MTVIRSKRRRRSKPATHRIADEEAQKEDLRVRVRSAGGNAPAVYATDKVSKVRELRTLIVTGIDEDDAEVKRGRYWRGDDAGRSGLRRCFGSSSRRSRSCRHPRRARAVEPRAGLGSEGEPGG